MSAPTIGNKPLTFYVEEEGDDFTFYVKDANRAIARELEKLPSPPKRKSARNKAFSFATRIFIKNLILTEDGIKPTAVFWKTLRAAEPGSPHEYLCNRLKPGFKKADNKKLEGPILKILNTAVTVGSLDKQKWEAVEIDKPDQEFLDKLKNATTKRKWRNRFLLASAFPDLIKPVQAGRGLICSSYVGNYLSITFRKISDDDGYKAADYQNKQHKRKTHLFSLSEYCERLFTEVFERTDSVEHAHGLLVITGSTKSGKSEVTRGLIQQYLDAKPISGRRRHLVTFEDPVERFFAKEEAESPSPWAAVPVSTRSERKDYTPREKPTDAGLLEEALMDALRQTPRVFFVGETREKAEWKVLLDFAATGHLIVTTAHAGSLVEAMHKIFEAVDVKTPADRSEIATKLLGVIHIRSADLQFETRVNHETKTPAKPTNILFPALWRRLPRGVASLTSDGLASLLPHRPRRNGNSNAVENNEGDEPSCLGRRSLIEAVFEQPDTNTELLAFFNNNRDALEAFKSKACVKSIEWDLQGV